jgi:hypothetical protein
MEYDRAGCDICGVDCLYSSGIVNVGLLVNEVQSSVVYRVVGKFTFSVQRYLCLVLVGVELLLTGRPVKRKKQKPD